MTTTITRSLRSMNVSDKADQLKVLAEALRAVVAEADTDLEVREALVRTVRREKVPLSDARYALTYARSHNLVSVNSHTNVITAD